jgi:hypothetical protein
VKGADPNAGSISVARLDKQNTKSDDRVGQSLGDKKNRTGLVKAIASAKQERCAQKFFGMMREQDVFGEKVQLTFKGKKSYKTTVGAVASIMIKIVLVFFIAYEFYSIITRKHPQTSVKYQVSDLTTDTRSLSVF